MDLTQLQEFVNQEVDGHVIPSLMDFIRIPNQSLVFDAEWETNGFVDQAANLLQAWAEAQGISGLTLERFKEPGWGPLLLIDIPGTKADAPTVFMYGHMDKQPPLDGWEEGTGPHTPVIKDDKLYGRGGVDDGYSIYAGLLAIKALQKFGLPHDRVVFLMESEEESSSPHLLQYIEKLRGKIGEPSLILCLDAGAGNYETLWVDESLRGASVINLTVSLMKSGMHSGEGSGVVASSFRVLRQLLDRIEDSRTGALILPELNMPITPAIYQSAVNSIQTIGEADYLSSFTKHEDVEFASRDTVELFLNNMFRPTVSVTGIAGLPDIANAGNVLRTHTSVILSVRIPPALDARVCGEAVVRELQRDPPYNAHVTAQLIKAGTGFMAPELTTELRSAISEASQSVFGKPYATVHMGGTIPLMNQLKTMFPNAQFFVTGALGPNSNAHCSNEALRIPYLKQLIACLSFVLHKLAAK